MRWKNESFLVRLVVCWPFILHSVRKCGVTLDQPFVPASKKGLGLLARQLQHKTRGNNRAQDQGRDGQLLNE